ncbi:MAG: helix-turn-helix domain-containing protein [Rhodospirillales bacterium]
MVELSEKQLQRIKVIENAVEGRITVAEAATLLGLSTRQVQRLKARYEGWSGCSTATGASRSPGVWQRRCAGRSWRWPKASTPALMIRT